MASVNFKNLSFIIDEDYIVQVYNDYAKSTLPDIEKGKACYKVIHGYDSPCPDCPIFTKKTNGCAVHNIPSEKEEFVTFSNIPLSDGRDGYIVTNHDVDVETIRRTKEYDLMQRKTEVYRIANYNLAYAYFEVNVTKNVLITDVIEVVDYVETKIDLDARGLHKPVMFDDFNKWRVERGIRSNQQEYLTLFNHENMIESFNKGERILEIQFRSKSTSGFDTWQTQTFYMYKSELDDDIYALGVLRDVAAKHLKEEENKRNEEILKVLSNDYSSVFYFDFKSETVSVTRLPDDLDVTLKKDLSTNYYKELWHKYLDRRVKNSDYKDIEGLADIDFLKNILKDGNTYSTIYRVGDEYDYKYFELKIAGLNDKNGNMVAAVIGVADRDNSIKEHEEQQRILENALKLAKKDSLTGIYNRTAYDFDERDLDNDVENGKIDRYAILMCDINNLKKTNDEYGHEKGNLLVINAARLICEIFRESNVYRIGGDEFVVILKDKDYDNRHILYENFKSTIKDNEKKKAPIYDRVSLASGLAEFNKDSDKSANDVFQRADVLMYKNKAEMKKTEK